MKLIKARALAISLTFLKRDSAANFADFLEARTDVETGEIVFGSRQPDQIASRGHAGMCYARYISDGSEAPLKRHI
jgi:hypothetical protein